MLSLFATNEKGKWIYGEAAKEKNLLTHRLHSIIYDDLALPYLGSKRKIAKELLIELIKHVPNATHFVDVFGGGGAMSLVALQNGFKVHYNDFDKDISELFKWLLECVEKNEKNTYGFLPDSAYEFIALLEFVDKKACL